MKARAENTIGIGWRMCVTIAIIIWMLYLCLLSRTMNPPGDPGETSAGAYLLAFLSGALFMLAWRPVIAVPLAIYGFFGVVMAANIVATKEERQFVEQFKATGKGPTPRRIFSNHWLAYDAERKHLSGGD